MSETWTKLKSSKYFLAVLIMALTLVGYWVPSHISVTMTPSLNKRVFYVDSNPDVDKLSKGDYVMFLLDPDLVSRLVGNAKITRTIKMITCPEGHTLTVNDRWYYCDGDFLGVAKTHSLKGIAVDNFVYNGVVPEGRLFVMGQNIDSYDSRYFGFINKTQILARAIPIL